APRFTPADLHVLGAAAEGHDLLGEELGHLELASALPRPHVDLAEERIDVDRQAERERRVARAGEVGADHVIEPDATQSLGDGGGLLAAELAQRRVTMALPTTAHVGRRLTVADEG